MISLLFLSRVSMFLFLLVGRCVHGTIFFGCAAVFILFCGFCVLGFLAGIEFLIEIERKTLHATREMDWRNGKQHPSNMMHILSYKTKATAEIHLMYYVSYSSYSV